MTLARAASVSVFIMVKNEAQCLAACLDALDWSDDIVVLDSFSTDDTCRIAESYPGVRVFQRHFTNFGDQRQFGLNALAFKHSWVLVIDADEIVPPALAAEVLSVVAGADAAHHDVYCLCRIPWFEGKPLRHNLTARFWIPRLVRHGQVTVTGRVHERITGKQPMGYLKSRLDHHQFCKGLANWQARRQSYFELECQAWAEGEIGTSPVADLFGPDRLRRRAALKQIYLRLPFRGLVYIVVNVVAFAAWRDGWSGLRYVVIEAQSQRGPARAFRKGL